MDVVVDWILPGLCVAVVLAAGWGYRRHRRAVLRTVTMPPGLRTEHQADLLAYVEEQSSPTRDWVSLSSFWADAGVEADGDRRAVVAPLLEAGALRVPDRTGISGLAEDVVDWAFVPVPDRVRIPDAEPPSR